jgi:hypothetical protein
MPRAEGLMVANEKSQEIGTTLTVGAFAVLTVAVHLLVNAFGGYGLFRDELYYIACSRHLAPGYVDHPSLSIVVLAATRLLFGQSLFAIRLVPAVLSGLAVVLLGRLVVRLGGGRLAVVVASTAFVASPQLLAFFSYYSMNSIDIVLWLLAGNALVGVIERPSLGRWAWLGLALGLGLANKTSVASSGTPGPISLPPSPWPFSHRSSCGTWPTVGRTLSSCATLWLASTRS